MESNNIEFTTAVGGQKVVLKSFITGAEKRSINEAFMNAKEIPAKWDADGAERIATTAEQIRATVKKAIEIVVISVNEKTTDLYNEIFNLDQNDTAEIKARVDDVTAGKKK